MMTTFIDVVGVVVSKASFILLIMIYMWMGHNPSTELIYYILTLFNQFASNIGIVLPSNLSRASQFYASIVRLNSVFHEEEIKKFESQHVEEPSISMRNVSLKYDDKEILSEVTMKACNPGLTVVTGSVGSGKSSILKVILHEFESLKEGKELSKSNS